MSTNFEWMRLAVAMALMVTGFILLPAFFLWKDNRDTERKGTDR